MKIELKATGKSDDWTGDIYHLFIDGKTDGIAYEECGMGGGNYSWKIKEKHMEKLMQIKCRDYPDELYLWNNTGYKIPPGTIVALGLNKENGKMLFEVQFGFSYDGPFSQEKYLLNPCLFLNKVNELSTGTILLKKEKEIYFNEDMEAVFIFKSDLKGTIGDKFRIISETLADLAKKAEKNLIKEVRSYLKTQKIKL